MNMSIGQTIERKRWQDHKMTRRVCVSLNDKLRKYRTPQHT